MSEGNSSELLENISDILRIANGLVIRDYKIKMESALEESEYNLLPVVREGNIIFHYDVERLVNYFSTVSKLDLSSAATVGVVSFILELVKEIIESRTFHSLLTNSVGESMRKVQRLFVHICEQVLRTIAFADLMNGKTHLILDSIMVSSFSFDAYAKLLTSTSLQLME